MRGTGAVAMITATMLLLGVLGSVTFLGARGVLSGEAVVGVLGAIVAAAGATAGVQVSQNNTRKIIEAETEHIKAAGNLTEGQ